MSWIVSRPFAYLQRVFVNHVGVGHACHTSKSTVACNASSTCFESVRDDLYASAAYGERSGTAGQPFPQDIELRDRSNEMLKICAAGSRRHALYEMIRKTAMQNIDRALSEAELNE